MVFPIKTRSPQNAYDMHSLSTKYLPLKIKKSDPFSNYSLNYIHFYLKQKEKKRAEQKKESDVEAKSDNSPVTVSTSCKGFNILFNQSTILNHITHSKSCEVV